MNVARAGLMAAGCMLAGILMASAARRWSQQLDETK
jgi:hypothetical protein